MQKIIANFALARGRAALARHRKAATPEGRGLTLLVAAFWNLIRNIARPIVAEEESL